jgi:DNA-binding NarL/FixJ family response regulator
MNSIRILIADDHDLIRQGLRALLEAQPGWTIVSEVSTGSRAVAEAKRLKPDIAILDIGLPELNGFLVTRQITRALPGIEILIVTMHESEETIHKALAAGAHGFLVKTNATRHLINAVEALAKHAPYFAPAATQVLLDDYLRPARREISVSESPRLTEREQEVMQLLAEGFRVKDIAARIGISVRTTETHRNNIMKKLGLHSTVDLVRYAIRNQIVDA